MSNSELNSNEQLPNAKVQLWIGVFLSVFVGLALLPLFISQSYSATINSVAMAVALLALGVSKLLNRLALEPIQSSDEQNNSPK